MKVYVARHGQTEWNAQNRICGRTDVELTEEGRRQDAGEGRTVKPAKAEVAQATENQLLGRGKEQADDQEMERRIYLPPCGPDGPGGGEKLRQPGEGQQEVEEHGSKRAEGGCAEISGGRREMVPPFGASRFRVSGGYGQKGIPSKAAVEGTQDADGDQCGGAGIYNRKVCFQKPGGSRPLIHGGKEHLKDGGRQIGRQDIKEQGQNQKTEQRQDFLQDDSRRA